MRRIVVVIMNKFFVCMSISYKNCALTHVLYWYSYQTTFSYLKRTWFVVLDEEAQPVRKNIQSGNKFVALGQYRFIYSGKQ